MRLRGARCGRSLTGYERSGNLSNSCLMGAGTSKKLREGLCCGRAGWGFSLLSLVVDAMVIGLGKYLAALMLATQLGGELARLFLPFWRCPYNCLGPSQRMLSEKAFQFLAKNMRQFDKVTRAWT